MTAIRPGTILTSTLMSNLNETSIEDVTGPCTPQLNAHKLGKIAATSDTNNSTTMDPIAMAIIWLDSQSELNYTEAAKNSVSIGRRLVGAIAGLRPHESNLFQPLKKTSQTPKKNSFWSI
jgi:hypothetical protein